MPVRRGSRTMEAKSWAKDRIELCNFLASGSHGELDALDGPALPREKGTCHAFSLFELFLVDPHVGVSAFVLFPSTSGIQRGSDKKFKAAHGLLELNVVRS